MTNVICKTAFDPAIFLSSCFTHLKNCAESVHEFFTHQKATIQKIETLNHRVFKTEGLLRTPGTLNEGFFKLKQLLMQEALLYNQHFSNPKIRKVYDVMRKNLERVQTSISPQSIQNWVNTDRNAEKVITSRWLLSNPSQRHFAAYYHLLEVPYKFSEIPAGSALLTDPYAYLRHMKIEKKPSIIHSIILKIKAVICRFLTGKQFTHVGFSMGNGRIFDLEKKSNTWIRGHGKVVDFGDKVFYGVVMAPKEHEMLAAYNKRFPIAPCATFQELMGKINVEIEKATQQNLVQLDVIDIVKTAIRKKRPNNYDATKAWKSGACHYSCSGTTSALFSLFGIEIQSKKIDENVMPTDFYKSHFFHLIYSIP
jgi:hypothetical protein